MNVLKLSCWCVARLWSIAAMLMIEASLHVAYGASCLPENTSQSKDIYQASSVVKASRIRALAALIDLNEISSWLAFTEKANLFFDKKNEINIRFFLNMMGWQKSILMRPRVDSVSGGDIQLCLIQDYDAISEENSRRAEGVSIEWIISPIDEEHAGILFRVSFGSHDVVPDIMKAYMEAGMSYSLQNFQNRVSDKKYDHPDHFIRALDRGGFFKGLVELN